MRVCIGAGKHPVDLNKLNGLDELELAKIDYSLDGLVTDLANGASQGRVFAGVLKWLSLRQSGEPDGLLEVIGSVSLMDDLAVEFLVDGEWVSTVELNERAEAAALAPVKAAPRKAPAKKAATRSKASR